MKSAREIIADWFGPFTMAGHGHPITGEEQADSILAALKEAGYVVVSEEEMEELQSDSHLMTGMYVQTYEELTQVKAMLEAASQQGRG